MLWSLARNARPQICRVIRTSSFPRAFPSPSRSRSAADATAGPVPAPRRGDTRGCALVLPQIKSCIRHTVSCPTGLRPEGGRGLANRRARSRPPEPAPTPGKNAICGRPRLSRTLATTLHRINETGNSSATVSLFHTPASSSFSSSSVFDHPLHPRRPGLVLFTAPRPQFSHGGTRSLTRSAGRSPIDHRGMNLSSAVAENEISVMVFFSIIF